MPLPDTVVPTALRVMPPVAAHPSAHSEAVQPPPTAIATVPHPDIADEVLGLQVHLPPRPRPAVRVRARPVAPAGSGVAIHSPVGMATTAGAGPLSRRLAPEVNPIEARAPRNTFRVKS